MLRVIAGTAKGLRLETPEGSARPTLDRVREALFSILHTQLLGARFADLYAGSGANGIEALSRGAACCVFVDSDRRAIDTISKNLFHTKLEHNARSYQLTLPRSLGVIASKEAPFDIVFCDPPYTGTDYALLLSQITENKLVTTDGIVVVESENRAEFPPSVGGLELTRHAPYGRTSLTFYT
ncbi:MAG: 16S rRNA (guanine(966)-N(2))-methyltransferase RsmD [Candidatus Hydrogenedentes bacterium]|nr:16S rRNA (guanine(966)-N(2))-methyltransferase RsmD [Candidatus Hydrogenedentota bacterium]